MARLGNLVRLLPLDLNEIPAHPSIAAPEPAVPNNDGNVAAANEPPDLFAFIQELLQEATNFTQDILPATFHSKGEKTSKPAIAKVELLSRTVPSSEIDQIPWANSRIPRKWSSRGTQKSGEAWFARKSRHANASSKGTADFDEFDYGLRHNHSKHEHAYTPEIYDSYRVLDWNEQIAVELDKGSRIEGYSEINMSIYEMCHKLPAILSNRVFPVLVLTAKSSQHAFIIVQTPVDIRNLKQSMYSNGRHLKAGDSPVKRKKPVLGVYTSIESCKLLPDRDIEWVMATASDAKGWLPMWAQKLGVPGAVIKDVGLFIRWIRERPPLTRSGRDSPIDAATSGTNGRD